MIASTHVGHTTVTSARTQANMERQESARALDMESPNLFFSTVLLEPQKVNRPELPTMERIWVSVSRARCNLWQANSRRCCSRSGWSGWVYSLSLYSLRPRRCRRRSIGTRVSADASAMPVASTA